MIPSLADNFGLDGSDQVPNATRRKSYVSTTERFKSNGDKFESEVDVDDPDDREQKGSHEDEDDNERADFEAGPREEYEDELQLTDAELMHMVREAESQATTYMQSVVRTAWNRSLKAYRSEHFEGSKYLSDQFRGRSKIFRPKTRSAVRKNQATAAEALFSTADVVMVSAQNEADPQQVASASIKQELLNYRLERSSGKAGIPWFQVSMGARMDSQITGICVTKQSWVFKEKKTGNKKIETYQESDGSTTKITHEETEIVIDRPDIQPIPPENMLIDPAAFWINPAQNSKYLIIRYPMHPSRVLEMMKSSTTASLRWFDITADELRSKAGSPMDAANTRRAREGGLDSKDTNATGTKFKVVWVYEVFLEHEGEDWTFWTLGANRLLCQPQRTSIVYPWLGGERPIVIGYGTIDSHRLFPQSPVETWQQLQQEGNDIANLRLDQMKHVVSPIAKVKRGRSVDIAQIQRRGPNTVLMVSDMEDLEWDRPPDVPQSAYMEANYLNSDFDDLAGAFNSSSVETNRNLNETVGGMRMLAGNANAVTEYDLRIWVETWVEPVLWQIVKLEEYYENDETLIALAADRSRLFQRFGMSEITDKLLMKECLLRVNVGTGASTTDPQQKIAKFAAAMQTAQAALQPFFEQGIIEIKPKTENILSEIFGDAGYKDGGERFFTVTPEDQIKPKQPPPDPKAEAQAKLLDAKTQAVAQKAQIDGQSGQQKIEHAGILAKIKAGAAIQHAQIKAGTATHSHALKATGMAADSAAKQSQAHTSAVADHHKLVVEKHRQKLEEDRMALEKERMQLERDRMAMQKEMDAHKLKMQKEQAAHQKKASTGGGSSGGGGKKKRISFERNKEGDIIGALVASSD
jgi:hypothetical protein